MCWIEQMLIYLPLIDLFVDPTVMQESEKNMIFLQKYHIL